MIETQLIQKLSRAEVYQELGHGNDAQQVVQGAQLLALDLPVSDELGFLFDFAWPDARAKREEETEAEYHAFLVELDRALEREYLVAIREAIKLLEQRVGMKLLERDRKVKNLEELLQKASRDPQRLEAEAALNV